MRIIPIFFLCIAVVSCSGGKREFASAEEAHAYANDNSNGFIETVEAADHVVSAKVNPLLRGEDAFTINLRISRTDGQSVLQHQQLSPQAVNDREMYLSFDLANDVYLRVDGEDVRAILHHYERNYKLKPAIDVAFTFPAIHPRESVQLVYRDNLFGMGLQELAFDITAFEPYTIKH